MADQPVIMIAPGIAGRFVPGPGERVLWIHGYTLDSGIWGDLWRRLPDWFHIGIDLPGHGASGEIAPEEDLPSMARRIGSVAKSVGARHLVGISFGGMVALQVAVEYPDMFTTITLGAPALGGGPQDKHAQARNVELMRHYGERGAGEWMTDLWMQSPPGIFSGAANHPELWESLRSTIDRHSWKELGGQTMQRLNHHSQSENDLARINSTTLVLIGDEDMAAFKRSAEIIRRSIPKCRRIHIPETGHLSILERPAVAAEILDAHFRLRAIDDASPDDQSPDAARDIF
jgi:2-succinyl-6-hydroxy-2,4-cyclohexadiene-1-carboxylate synthase